MLATPEFTNKGEEYCYNKSAAAIIRLSIEKGKNLLQEPTHEACLAAIREELHKYADIKKQTKRATCISTVIVKAEGALRGENKSICHDMNCFMSEIIDNYDMIEQRHHELPSDFNEQLIKVLGFGFDPAMLTTKPKEATANTYFEKRWSWYNQSVNFEHVCFVMTCILTERVNLNKETLDGILYPFLFYMKAYQENKELLKFFVYHMVKFIRIHYTKPAKYWDPVRYMTNLRFGCYIDPNVEIYGNTRLSTNKNEALSMFSNAPRSTVDTDEKAIWINWNGMTPIISKFSQESEKLYAKLFRTDSNANDIKDTYELFNLLTHIDILPRKILARNGFVNLYHRCVADDGKDVTDEELIELVLDLLVQSEAYEHKFGRTIDRSKIGVTYFVGSEIRSRVLDITLEELCDRINDKQKPIEGISLVPYIVECDFDPHGHIHRREHGINDPKYPALLRKIAATKSSIEKI